MAELRRHGADGGQPLVFDGLLLQLHFFRNVPDKRRVVYLFARGYLRHRKLDGKSLAALSPRADCADPSYSARLAGAFIARDVTVMLRRIGFGHQHVNFLPRHFRSAIAEDSLRRGVEHDDLRLTVNGDDRVLGGFEQAVKRVLRLSLLGEIAHDHLHRRAAFPSQRPADGLDVDQRAVQTHSALNSGLVWRAGLQSSLVPFLYFCSFVRMD